MATDTVTGDRKSPGPRWRNTVTGDRTGLIQWQQTRSQVTGRFDPMATDTVTSDRINRTEDDHVQQCLIHVPYEQENDRSKAAKPGAVISCSRSSKSGCRGDAQEPEALCRPKRIHPAKPGGSLQVSKGLMTSSR